MTAEELADKIYEAAGMVVNDEQAFGIGKLLMEARRHALENAWGIIADKAVDGEGMTYFEIMNRDQEMMDAIMDLKKSSYV